MQIKRLPDDFVVEEHVHLPGQHGPYAYYRVEKRNLSTLSVRDEMASLLKVTPSYLSFPAFKDRSVVAVQYTSVRKRAPERLEGRGFVAERIAWGSRALRPTDLVGNRYTLTLRDLDAQQAAAIAPLVQTLGEKGLPNYFDDQRFGSFSTHGFIGKAILMRDAERAVWLYLAGPMAGDRREIRNFKRLVRTHWGQWGYLLHQAPQPSNFRSVLTFLKDNPQDHRKALNLIHDRLLSIYLVAFQSWIWDRILGHYLTSLGYTDPTILITGLDSPLPPALPEELLEMQLSMPNLTVRYPDAVLPSVEAVLGEEGMTLEDFKARILRRVYLPKGERFIWFKPSEVVVGDVTPDVVFPERWAVPVSFTLAPRQYATLLVKAIAAHLGVHVRVR